TRGGFLTGLRYAGRIGGVEMHYQITYDDYLDASEEHWRRVVAEKRKKSKAFRVGKMVLIGEAVAVVVLLMLVCWFLKPGLLRAQLRFAMGDFARFCLDILPVTSLVVLLALLGIVQKKPRLAVRMAWVWFVGFVLLAVILFWLATRFPVS